VVFDEPTEHLDVATADELTADILAATRDCATVLITHTLRGLTGVDEVIVLRDGKVVERGTPGDLLVAGGWLAEGVDREQLAGR
jgi:ATP-binding cassette subfamily C protein CydCD